MNDLGKGYDRAGKYKFRIDLSNEKKYELFSFVTTVWE